MWYILLITLVLTTYAAEQVRSQSSVGVEAVEIRDRDRLLRTQYLPVKKQVRLEVLGQNEVLDNKRECDYIPEETKIQNSAYQMKNGKIYKVTRYKKKRKISPCEQQNNNTTTAERRVGNNGQKAQQQVRNHSRSLSTGTASKDFYNFLSSLSGGQLQNTTNYRRSPFSNVFPSVNNKNEIIEDPVRSNGSHHKSWHFWTNSNPVATQTIQKKKEKLQKLLNLFTIVQFDNGGCYIDGIKGTCYTEQECLDKGGRPMGPCAQGYGSCCYFEKTCGQLTAENCTYFVNEGFPEPSYSAPGICALVVEKAHPDVRQLRLEFETFQLRGPANGTCIFDRFLVTGQNRNSIVPDLCGVNNGQHMYVDVDAVTGPFNLNVVTMGQEVGRKFRIKVTQLRSSDSLLAPQNCLQYYPELTGIIESFNYQNYQVENVGEARPGYFNNMNYEVCIKKAASFCAVSYSTQVNDEGEAQFQLVNFDGDGDPTIPRGQAGAEIFNCPDDYIIIDGVRLCGDKLNDASIELDYTRSYPVMDQAAGPAGISVKTDPANVGRGFRLMYRQNPCVD